MCNHNIPPAANWEFDNDQYGFTLKAAHDIKKDEEITISYGKKDCTFFFSYGFVYKPDEPWMVRLTARLNS